VLDDDEGSSVTKNPMHQDNTTDKNKYVYLH